LQAERKASESNCEVAVATCKKFYQSEMTRILSLSKVFSAQEVQNHHDDVQRKALEKFKQLSGNIPSTSFVAKENDLILVCFEKKSYVE
jgi:hypothetical protein